jgi:hypothetical protein
MNLSVTGHHVAVTPAIRSYVEQKLERVLRHFDHVIDVNVILSVERDELKIPAGLQDRVIQVYEGVVYMDCTRQTGFVPTIPKEKADLIYLCFPNNPTGGTITIRKPTTNQPRTSHIWKTVARRCQCDHSQLIITAKTKPIPHKAKWTQTSIPHNTTLQASLKMAGGMTEDTFAEVISASPRKIRETLFARMNIKFPTFPQHNSQGAEV